MLIELAAAGFLVGKYIYHRITEHEPSGARGTIELPITEEGAPVPLIFGRCRVTTPIVSWVGQVTAETGSVGNGSEGVPTVYSAPMLFTLGMGFDGGANGIHGGWAGDRKLSWLPPLAELPPFGATGFVGGRVETLLGDSSQVLVDPATWLAVTAAGARMLAAGISADRIPGYRGRLSVFLYNPVGGWYFGPSFPSYQFEASSYGTNHPQLGTYARVGDDSNPINVVHAILTAPHLLGLPESMIDIPNFQAAQYTLHTEQHGYSRFWNQRTSAAEMLNDVFRQIDGIPYFDQRTGKIRIKLIRADYSTPDLFEINRRNCEKLVGFAMGGRTNRINKVRVTYLDRAEGYQQLSATAQSMANAVGQDGQVAEEVIDYPGCTSAAQAKKLAERELFIRSMPLVKCRATGVSRAALRLNPGDPVRLVWTNPDVNAVFRVMKVERGTLEDGGIALDLLLDSGYVWRNQNPQPGGLGGISPPPVIPTPPVVLGG